MREDLPLVLVCAGVWNAIILFTDYTGCSLREWYLLSFGIFVHRECDIGEYPPLVLVCAGVWNAIILFADCHKYGVTQGPLPIPTDYHGFLWLIGRDEATPTTFIC